MPEIGEPVLGAYPNLLIDVQTYKLTSYLGLLDHAAQILENRLKKRRVVHEDVVAVLKEIYNSPPSPSASPCPSSQTKTNPTSSRPSTSSVTPKVSPSLTANPVS